LRIPFSLLGYEALLFHPFLSARVSLTFSSPWYKRKPSDSDMGLPISFFRQTYSTMKLRHYYNLEPILSFGGKEALL